MGCSASKADPKNTQQHVEQLQAEIDRLTQANSALELRTATLQSLLNDQKDVIKQLKRQAAAATVTGTDGAVGKPITTLAVVEGHRSGKLQAKLDALQEELEQTKQALVVANAVTTGTATGEAEQIKDLKLQMRKRDEEIEDLRERLNTVKQLLKASEEEVKESEEILSAATAAAAASTMAATAEVVELTKLKDKVDTKQEQLDQKEKDLVEAQELIQKLQKDNRRQKDALAIAIKEATAGAGDAANRIEELQNELRRKDRELERMIRLNQIETPSNENRSDPPTATDDDNSQASDAPKKEETPPGIDPEADKVIGPERPTRVAAPPGESDLVHIKPNFEVEEGSENTNQSRC